MYRLIPFLLLFIGCVSPQTTANRHLTSTALSIQAASQGWDRWVCAQGATPQQEAEVRLAKAKYDVAMTAAQGAYLSLGSTGDTNGWSKACIALRASSESLAELIRSYTTDAYGDAVIATNKLSRPH